MVLLSVCLASVAWAQPFSTPTPAPDALSGVRSTLVDLDLPEPVVREALASAARALARPAVRAEAARVAEALDAARALVVPEWSLDPGLSLAWDGSVGAELGLGLRVPLLSPSRDRERHDATSAARRSRLELELRAREAAQDAIEARLALWRLSRQLRLSVDANTMQETAPAVLAGRAARLARLEPDLRFEQRRLRLRIARGAGVRHAREVPSAAWWGLLARPVPETCADGSTNVRLASEALRAALASERVASAATPSVTLGASTDVRLPEIGAAAPDVEASLWLSVGFPARATTAGRFEARADATGLQLSVHARSDRDGWRGGGSSVAVARADLDEARFAARERAAQALHDLASARAGLDRLGAATGTGTAVDRLERDWERADLEARVAMIAVHLALDCAGAARPDAAASGQADTAPRRRTPVLDARSMIRFQVAASSRRPTPGTCVPDGDSAVRRFVVRPVLASTSDAGAARAGHPTPGGGES